MSRAYPAYWPAVLWLGVSSAAAFSAFAPAIMAAPEQPVVAHRPAACVAASPKAEHVPGAMPARCERDAFGGCKL